MPHLKRASGMTYLEVLIAMVIFSFALVSITKFGDGAIRMNNVSDRNTRAAQYAQGQFELMKSSPWVSNTSGTSTKPDGFTLTWRTTPTPTAATYMATCSLTVQWSDMSHEYARVNDSIRHVQGYTGNTRPYYYKQAKYVYILTRSRM